MSTQLEHPSVEHPAEAHAAHGQGDHIAMFRDRFWLSLLLSLPVVVFSEMVQQWFGYSLPSFPGDDLVAPVLGTAVFFYGGWPFRRAPSPSSGPVSPG